MNIDFDILFFLYQLLIFSKSRVPITRSLYMYAHIKWQISSPNSLSQIYVIAILNNPDTILALPGALPMSVSALRPYAKDMYKRMREFIEKEIMPVEVEFFMHATKAENKWTINPLLEELKVKTWHLHRNENLIPFLLT